MSRILQQRSKIARISQIIFVANVEQ